MTPKTPGWGFREIVAGALVAMFGYVLWYNPKDQIIIGALLTAFAASWGFYLGGSKTGSDTAAKNADAVAAGYSSGGTDDGTAKGTADDPLHVEGKLEK
jgi:hypothetical protein